MSDEREARYAAFGEYVLEKRVQKGIATQAELAQQLGVRQQTVSRWEAGTSRPRTDELAKLARVLKVDVAELSTAAGYSGSAVTVSFDRPLPLSALSPESFERFSLDLLTSLYRGTAEVHAVGKTGHKQYGIDIEAHFHDGELHTFQCKREAQFGPAKVRKAVNAQTIPANKKYILLSRVASPEARMEIRGERDWYIWDQTNITREFRMLPISEQVRIVDIYFPSQRFALTGEMNAGPWLTVDKFFAPFLADGRAFNQSWNLVGRDLELNQIAEALADRNVVVTSLIGRPGEGKSRLLLAALGAFSAANPDVQVCIASQGTDIDVESLKKLGSAEKLLVVDDAHDRNDIKLLIHYVADRSSNTRLLLVYRSYWTEVIQTEMARVFRSGDLVKSVRLATQKKEDAIAIARQVLEKYAAPTDAAKQIADVAYDSPLEVVVGAQVVAKEGVHPELFRSSDYFRTTVLNRFEQMIAQGVATGKDQDRVHQVLRILALIQPVVPDDQHVIELLARIEGISAPDTSNIARRLIDSGVLFKRGMRYRLSPDLLADSIIEGACITTGGASNGYAEQVFEAAIPEHKEHILLNLGRLDWRRNAGDTSSSPLLDGIWSSLEWEGDYRNIQVKAAAAAAYYQPRHALNFARRLVGQGHGQDEDVCRMINSAAHNIAYVSDACELLWEVAKGDVRPTNQHPNHPLRLLTELAAPQPMKPIEFCEAIVDFALSLLPYEESWTDLATPFDILKGALVTEGHFTSRATSREYTLSAYGVNVDVVAPMRRRIIDAIFGSLSSKNKLRAFAAAKLLQSCLQYPIGILNRKPSDAERAFWSEEFVDTLTRLNAMLDTNHLPSVVSVRIAESVSWHAYHSQGETSVPAIRILSRLDDDLGTKVTRMLMDGWGHSTYEIDTENLDIHRQRQEQLAKDLVKAYPNATDLVHFMEEQFADIISYGGGLPESARIFVEVLLEGRLALAHEVLAIARRTPQSPISSYGPFALSSLLRHEPDKGHAYVDELLAQGDINLPFIAFTYALGAIHGRLLDDSDRNVIRRIFNSSTPEVLFRARGIFREMAEKDKQFAIDLLANVNPGLMQESEGEIFMWLDDDRHIPFDSISDDDLKRILDLFLIPDRLDGYYMHRFLSKVAKRNPRQVLELIKARLERAMADDNWRYWPVGILTRETSALNLLMHPDGGSLFCEVLDWALPKASDHKFMHRFDNLIAGVFGFEEKAYVSILEAWSAGGSADHFAVIAAVLREVPSQFVFSELDFVSRILRAARSVSKSSYEEVLSSLYGSAISGVRSGTPGKPFPQDEKMKASSEAALAALSKANPAYGLYDDLRRHAEDAIERQLAEGRAMDEEDEDL